MRRGAWVLLTAVVLVSCGRPTVKSPAGDAVAAPGELALTIRVVRYSPDDLHMQVQDERGRRLPDEWYDVVLCAIESPEEYAGQQLRILRGTRPAGDRPLDERLTQAGAVLKVECSSEGLSASLRDPAAPAVWAAHHLDIQVVAPRAE